MKTKLLMVIAASALCGTTLAQTQAPAFPGAEGNGRYTTGGRGGSIIHVTNLNDNGIGSFRAAVSGGSKKIVVFDVGGVIPLASDLKIGANTTVLGQTAPYPGITLRYYTVEPGANNIIRFIRVRRGQEKDVNDGADAIWTRNITNAIIDHCSFSWSIDEVASFYDNNNFTMQWCTIGESLNNAGHNKGAHGYGGIWGGKLASFHHNMIAHTSNRAPRFNGARYNWSGYTSNTLYSTYNWANAVQAENVDFRNCLIFDWGSGGCYGGPGGGYINMVNNYYKATPETSNKNRVTQISIANSTTSDDPTYMNMTSRYYISGNYVYGYGANYDWSGVKYDSGIQTINGERYTLDSMYYYGTSVEHVNNAAGIPCVKIKLDAETAPAGDVTTHSAETAYAKILSYGGASQYRDDVDARYMTEATNGASTYTGSVTGVLGRIDVVSDVDGYTESNFPTGSRAAGYDTDNDGMPDIWETANGLNPNDASDAQTYSLDQKGYYTNLEVYANSLVEDIMKSGNADAISTVDEYYPTTVKADGLDYYSGIIVERVTPDTTQTDTTEVAPLTGTQGSLTWAFTSGAAESATYTSAVAEGVASSTVSIGSNLSYVGTKSVSGITETLLQPTTLQSAAASDNAVTFSFTLKDGYLFQPNNVSFYASRIGTDGGKIDVSYSTSTASTTLTTGLQPERNSISPYYTSFNQSVTDIPAAEGTHSLTFNIYNLANTKQYGFNSIVIDGVINTTTGISRPAILVISSDAPCYNLGGQRVSASYRGLVIKNGKKYIQK
ncbi:MAG: pectate lyase [Prevotella sp.]|nr:pectate lyase [Prevotella sp.]